MDIQKIAGGESARQDVYQGLAECYQLPGERLNDILQRLENRLKDMDSQALPYAVELIYELDRQSVERLTIEYARLFVGPYSLPAPPYGSIYIENERKVMGDSTLDVLKRYRQFGLDLPSGLKEVPDHITVELEFMYFLIFKEVESILSDDPAASQFYLSEQAAFLSDHLMNWIPDFTENMITYSGIEFYRCLAKLTHLFISEDFKFLERVGKSTA